MVSFKHCISVRWRKTVWCKFCPSASLLINKITIQHISRHCHAFWRNARRKPNSHKLRLGREATEAEIFFGNIIIDLSRKFTTWLKARRKSNFGKTRKCNRRVDRVHLKRHLRKWQKLWPNCGKFSQNVFWYTWGQWLPSLIKGLTFIAQG